MHAFLQALIQNSAAAIVRLSAHRTVRFSSETSARVMGYAVAERLGRNGFELMHPDDVARTREAFKACLRQPGVPINAEYRIRHKNGDWREIEAVAVNRL